MSSPRSLTGNGVQKAGTPLGCGPEPPLEQAPPVWKEPVSTRVELGEQAVKGSGAEHTLERFGVRGHTSPLACEPGRDLEVKLDAVRRSSDAEGLIRVRRRPRQARRPVG